MKKFLAILLALCLTFCMMPAALANSVEANVIDQLRNVVKEYLDEEGYFCISLSRISRVH